MATELININIGVLGHVDSGKTSLVKALSTALSTAALDKHPESQRRGITLDLGFSSFIMDIPVHLKQLISPDHKLQFTLVDCPGHASLIRTIIGGAQIIDMIVLVVDINKGIQTQTAECIVLGEITTEKIIIVLNKVDLIPEEQKEARIAKMKNRIQKVFSMTKFPNPIIILTAAAVGGEKVAAVGSVKDMVHGVQSQSVETHGVDKLLEAIQQNIELPKRNKNGPFYYAIDHCFAIKGHGTVLTGTVLRGSVGINSMIELPELNMQRKVVTNITFLHCNITN
jgi:selenocysteine-specific elongation factor